MSLKLIKDPGNGDGIIPAAAAIGKYQGRKPKSTGEKFPEHPLFYHKRAKCDLSPNTTDPICIDKRKAEKWNGQLEQEVTNKDKDTSQERMMRSRH